MRLIDADNIFFYCNYEGYCIGDIDSCKECNNYVCNFRDIQKQPTAYDVDNVVRKLNLESAGSNIKESLGLLKAIKIVKEGVNNET